MIIGLSGYAQSGKDTFASILVQKYGYTRVSFADSVRELAYATNPMFDFVAGEPRFLKDAVDRWGWEEVKKHTQVRRLLQNIGLGARTVIDDSVWISLALKKIHNIEKVVFTDVRFENEADQIKSLGGKIWRVKRINIDAVNSHVSESELDSYNVDQIFVNNGTIEELTILLQTRMRAYV
jgi:dephospho-CoA kinase